MHLRPFEGRHLVLKSFNAVPYTKFSEQLMRYKSHDALVTLNSSVTAEVTRNTMFVHTFE